MKNREKRVLNAIVGGLIGVGFSLMVIGAIYQKASCFIIGTMILGAGIGAII